MTSENEIRWLGIFWRAARYICTEVSRQQPDLVVGLLRTGWAPVFAARVLWEHACQTPFPAALPINFGIEKQKSRIDGVYQGWFSYPEGDGRFLAWLTGQRDWQAELKALVSQALGPDVKPKRVLVIDDFVHSGATRIAVLGLFLAAFPQTNTRFLGGRVSGWKAHMVLAWMERHYPRTLARMRADFGRQNVKLPPPLPELASGTEDVHPESLYWRRVRPDGKLMRQLTGYLPYEAWMECPTWINTAIANHIRRQADETGWSLADGLQTWPQPNSDRLDKKTLLWRELYLRGQLTYRDFSRIIGTSAKKSKYFLDRMARRGELYRIGDDPMPHYTFAPQEVLERLKRQRRFMR